MMGLITLAVQDPQLVTVGRVRAIYWPQQETAAMALAEMADAMRPWPGLPNRGRRPVRLIVAPDAAKFDSLTKGRVPEWGAGAAFPASNTIVVRLTGDVMRVLRHEMAHLALRESVRRAPLWFDEGYAARAAEEWSRLDVLRVNWALLTGAAPSLSRLNGDLRGDEARAETAYALATTAVLLLERLGGKRGLAPLIENLGETRDLDRALRVTNQMTLGQFEALWQRDLHKRYGWALVFGSMGIFWAVVGLALASLWGWRRRRYHQRRLDLDEGWAVPGELDDATQADHASA
ncbi:MAG: peptidase MA family metallohydrolase [Gemmatimonadales bacterium]